ncbi:MAG TPA: POTRA domain-containing protein, partial [Geobacteraceae bacterium]|nr:POTRA domain-containing protein [Geobacteraceae bacterium]
MHKLKKNFTAAAPTFFLSALIISRSTVFAIQAPVYNIGAAVKETASPANETQKKGPTPENPAIFQEGEKTLSKSDGEKIFVKDFRIEGADQLDQTELSALLIPYGNRELTMSEITEATNKLTLYCRQMGYLVAKAYVPRQDAGNGILVIKIIMGNYGKFSLKNTSPVRNFLLQGVFDKTREASPTVTRYGLERAVLLAGDMPGIKPPTVSIAPGATPGTSDFEVKADAAQRINGYLTADNQGSSFTGKNRLYGGIDINSPLGITDRFSVSGMITDKTDQWNLRLAYGFPLACNGLRG